MTRELEEFFSKKLERIIDKKIDKILRENTNSAIRSLINNLDQMEKMEDLTFRVAVAKDENDKLKAKIEALQKSLELAEKDLQKFTDINLHLEDLDQMYLSSYIDKRGNEVNILLSKSDLIYLNGWNNMRNNIFALKMMENNKKISFTHDQIKDLEDYKSKQLDRGKKKPIKYNIQELLDQSDYSGGPSKEDIEWDQAPPIGDEIL